MKNKKKELLFVCGLVFRDGMFQIYIAFPNTTKDSIVEYGVYASKPDNSDITLGDFLKKEIGEEKLKAFFLRGIEVGRIANKTKTDIKDTAFDVLSFVDRHIDKEFKYVISMLNSKFTSKMVTGFLLDLIKIGGGIDKKAINKLQKYNGSRKKLNKNFRNGNQFRFFLFQCPSLYQFIIQTDFDRKEIQ